MRTAIPLLLLAACAPDGALDPERVDARQKGDADLGSSEPTEARADEADPTIVGDCIDTECTVLWVSTDPPAGEGTWLLDGEEVAFDKGVKVEVGDGLTGLTFVNDTMTLEGSLASFNDDGSIVIQSVGATCSSFRIRTVGGCLTAGPRVRFDAPVLGAPVIFDTAPAGLASSGFAWVAWWPDGNGGMDRWLTANPPVAASSVPMSTGTNGLEFRHVVPNGVAADITVQHEGSGRPHELMRAVCGPFGGPSYEPPLDGSF